MVTTTKPPPQTIGRYRIVRRLGTGGMAEVFLAKSSGAEGIEKLLVLKRILPTFSRSPKFITMFIDEAKVAMRLNHPNIVQVYAFEQVGDEFLLAMELVDGMDLGRLVSAARRKQTRLSPQLCALIVMELAKGLDYAHKRRDESGQPMDIVHRDVSPQNVLMSYEGVVKVADFGIARARMVSEETGVIKGKFSYMSPEQARGQRVDQRSDVYSLGILLAELLMNRAMYPGEKGMEVLEKVRDGRVTLPRQVDKSVPLELDSVVRRATAYDREERYQSARSLAGALSRWLHVQEDLYDASALESFIAEVAPREKTSPNQEKKGTASESTYASLPRVGRQSKERRNVVVIHGRFCGQHESGEITGVDRTGRSASEQAVQVLDNMAYKYGAILEWPAGVGRESFRFTLGIARVSVDDPLHAARLAMDVLDALAGLSADLLVPLTAALGLSRGRVLITRASDGRLRFEPLGAVFTVAKALADAGEHDMISATGEVYRLARRVFSFDEDGELVWLPENSQGPECLRAYRLHGARTRDDRAAEALEVAGDVGLLGRSEEIQALSQTYEEVAHRKKSAYIAVTGELGVGKSALVAAALGSFSPDPTLLRVECLFGSKEIPYGALAELLKEAFGISDELGKSEIRKRVRKRLSALLPKSERRWIFDLIAPLVAPSTEAREEPVDLSNHLVRAMRKLLGAIAQNGPLVVWGDALQFADKPSLQLFESLVSRTYDAPLLVVVCTRPEERIEPLLQRVPALDLGDLNEADRLRLISARFGDARVPVDIQQAIVNRAGGNPFFIMELIDALLDRGALRTSEENGVVTVHRQPGKAFALPTTLEDVIAVRLVDLPELERHTIMWLSVVGPGLRQDELNLLTGQDLHTGLSGLEERGLVQRRAGGGYYFPSAVVRHVAYERVDASDRVRMHRRVAQFLTELDMPVAPARLGYHREQAGNRTAAADAYITAGAMAHAMYSHEEALRFYARALALLPLDAAACFDAHEAREQILRTLGRRREQHLALEALRQFAERSGDAKQIAVAFNRFARFDLDASRPTGVDAMLRRALDAAIEAGDKASEVEALRLFGQLRREQGDIEGAINALDRALIRAGVDPAFLSARGQTLVQKSILLWRSARLDESVQASAEAVVIFRRLGLKSLEAQALSSLGVALAHIGSFEDSITLMRASIALDREVGERLHLGRKVSNVGQLYAELGDKANALAFLRRSLDVFQALPDQSGHTDALCALAELYAEQINDLDMAETVLREARLKAERLNDHYDLAHVELVETRLSILRGDYASAEHCARLAIEHARNGGARGYEILAGATRAVALGHLQRLDEAREVAHEIRRAVEGRQDIERAERVHFNVSKALSLVGETDAARKAMDDARLVVEERLYQIRSETARQFYLHFETIRSIRGGIKSDF